MPFQTSLFRKSLHWTLSWNCQLHPFSSPGQIGCCLSCYSIACFVAFTRTRDDQSKNLTAYWPQDSRITHTLTGDTPFCDESSNKKSSVKSNSDRMKSTYYRREVASVGMKFLFFFFDLTELTLKWFIKANILFMWFVVSVCSDTLGILLNVTEKEIQSYSNWKDVESPSGNGFHKSFLEKVTLRCRENHTIPN